MPRKAPPAELVETRQMLRDNKVATRVRLLRQAAEALAEFERESGRPYNMTRNTLNKIASDLEAEHGLIVAIRDAPPKPAKRVAKNRKPWTDSAPATPEQRDTGYITPELDEEKERELDQLHDHNHGNGD